MKLLLGYNENDSFIHKLDPRVKLLWLLGNGLALMSFQDVRLLSLCLAIVLLTTMLAGTSLIIYLPMIKIMAIIGVQFILLQGIFRHEGAILFHLSNINFYLGGVLVGIKGILRLIALAFSFLQFLMWTSPKELTLLFVKSGLPHKYAILTGMTLHFIPVIEKDLQDIYESQQARGLELTTGLQKVKGLLPVMLPLILRSLKRTKEVALSMELKGYTRYPTRTFLESISFSSADTIVFCSIIVYFGGLISFQIK